MGRLANKNILITGGNSGIGLAAGQEFDREGARVAICGLNEGRCKRRRKRLEPEASPFARTSAISPTSTHVRRDQAGVRAPGRRLRKCRLQRVPVVRRGDRAKLRQGNSRQFQRRLLHDSKSLAATQARLFCNHQCVRWRAQGVADNLDRLDLQGAVVHLARILSAELVDRGFA